MHAGADPDLPQMISCSWVGGLPTLSLIPHTDPSTFAAAAQAFAALHYAQHQPGGSTPTNLGLPPPSWVYPHRPGSTPTKHRQHTSRDMPTTNEDVGQPISRVSTTASKVKVSAADDVGERVMRDTAELEEDCGQQISRTLGSDPPSSSKAAQSSRDQQPTVLRAGFARHGTAPDTADLLGGGHQSSSAEERASPSLCDKAHVVPEAAAACQQLHSSAGFFQLTSQCPVLQDAPDQSATSLTKPVSQMEAALVAKGGEGLLDSAAVGSSENSVSEGVPLHSVDPGPNARTRPLTHTQNPPGPPKPRAGPPKTQAKPSPGSGDMTAAAASGLLVFEDR